MATDDVNESLPAAAELPATEAEKQPHKLERKWSFWFDNQSKKGVPWGASLRKAYTFDTVEDFWGFVFPLFSFDFKHVSMDFVFVCQCLAW